jgi:hypothetical protein
MKEPESGTPFSGKAVTSYLRKMINAGLEVPNHQCYSSHSITVASASNSIGDGL